MSLNFILVIPEAVIIAADTKRNLIKRLDQSGQENLKNYYIGKTPKIFLGKNNAIISTESETVINGKQIGKLLKAFSETVDESWTVEQTARKLLDHWNSIENFPNLIFYVTGYENKDADLRPALYKVKVHDQVTELLGEEEEIYKWWSNGHPFILNRIFNQPYNKDGKKFEHHNIHFNQLSIDNAIELIEIVFNTTFQLLRFQHGKNTMGNQIELLIMKPEKSHHKSIPIKENLL